ncbi:MAG TPA: hypothetical protein VFR36_09685 [Sphingomicrobium sp.]|nr:hypothetical protein [Sphingomicrobium sp.]
MDIIAAHRQGLVEKLESEAAALAGRPQDFGQRVVVLHHLYNHSRGGHAWALAEARRELRMARAIENLRRRLARWGWLGGSQEQSGLKLESLAEALGEQSRARCATTYLAYRLSGMQALREEAEQQISPELLDALGRCHAARRSGEPATDDERQLLFDLSERLAASAADERLAVAWAAVEATGLGRAARSLLGGKACERALARDRKRGWQEIERGLRNDNAMPASFRANPAQHFFALQQALAERRRKSWRDACDLEADSFELAA